MQETLIKTPSTNDILGHLDLCRIEISRRLDKKRRVALGQFLTSAPTARLMASMLTVNQDAEVRLLDCGAGIGTLFSACVEAWLEKKPRKISVVAYETEPLFKDYLNSAFDLCRKACESHRIEFEGILKNEDFVTAAVSSGKYDLFTPRPQRFSHAILNPPYHKINTNSDVRRKLRACGIETSNLYTGFMALSAMLLDKRGQMVSISPRSFCNGPYFRPFRKYFLRLMNIERLHLFHSRDKAFSEDEVLQENIIVCARKGGKPSGEILITSSFGPEDEINTRVASKEEVILPDDPDSVIHVVTDDLENKIAKLASRFTSTLESLGLKVSTGRVVDFRAEGYIVRTPEKESAPLIYPAHFEKGYVRWPVNGGRKPNGILIKPQTLDLLIPSQNYVLVKRFSSKEERKRIVAAVYEASRIPTAYVGFENHVNYFHRNNQGLDLTLAKGLGAFLNSSIVDTLFRHFSGHTQVNAADLKIIKYPNLKELEALGKYIGSEFPDQEELDKIVQKELLKMSTSKSGNDPLSAKAKIQEALSILKSLGLPRAQQNERSALTLLALLGLEPSMSWDKASAPLMGITPMMDFFSKYYEKKYAPNTRETVRRQTVHQFLQAGIIVENPDNPDRPTNSPKAVYQTEKNALALIRTYKTSEWNPKLRKYLTSMKTLAQRYAREREMTRIPIKIAKGTTITLSPGGQNVLIEQIIKEFGSRFTPGGKLIYVGDTDEKFAYFEEQLLNDLGVRIEAHGKMPDVVIYYEERNWLVLIEAVTSHGPMNPKRYEELKELFKGSKAGIVFVTAFPTRKAMVKHLSDICWETEVWVSESPSHLIHFNGERFLGPYEG